MLLNTKIGWNAHAVPLNNILRMLMEIASCIDIEVLEGIFNVTIQWC